MSSFEAKRIVKEYTQAVSASASEVFPLLCPVREYDWIDGWKSEIIYSESGVAENNCIFRSHLSERGEELWVVSRYDPDNFAIEFTTFNRIGLVMKLDISVEDHGTEGTVVRFRHTFTGLNEQGNLFVADYTDTKYQEMMGFLGKSLDHYCTTGRMLKKPTLIHGLHSVLRGH